MINPAEAAPLAVKAGGTEPICSYKFSPDSKTINDHLCVTAVLHTSTQIPPTIYELPLT